MKFSVKISIFLITVLAFGSLARPVFSFSGDSKSFWEQDLEERGEKNDQQVGWASWYGGKFHGRKTASGERYNKHDMTCASRHLPFGTMLEVTNLSNGKTAVVRVNDRGPYRKNRVLDFSYAVAQKLGFLGSGVTQVAYMVISPVRD